MKRNFSRGFTLVELLTVIAIIAILAGLILSVSGLAHTKSARSRAEVEIKALSAACENYKADNGIYPRGSVTPVTPPAADDTDALDPRVDALPTDAKYTNASLAFYKMLSGDANADGVMGDTDVATGARAKVYLEFKPENLKAVKDASGKITAVSYVQDPWGNSYGYSTASAKADEDVQSGATPTRADKGYNPTFDLWSTGGSKPQANLTTWARDEWIKNW